MALGTVTQVQADPHAVVPTSIGDLKITITNIVPSTGGDYPTGGVVVTPAQLGLSTVLFSQGEVIITTGSNNQASSIYYNPATSKLQMFTTGATGAFNEVGNNTNLSGLTVQLMSFGY